MRVLADPLASPLAFLLLRRDAHHAIKAAATVAMAAIIAATICASRCFGPAI